jgi:hypothetical protein
MADATKIGPRVCQSCRMRPCARSLSLSEGARFRREHQTSHHRYDCATPASQTRQRPYLKGSLTFSDDLSRAKSASSFARGYWRALDVSIDDLPLSERT